MLASGLARGRQLAFGAESGQSGHANTSDMIPCRVQLRHSLCGVASDQLQFHPADVSTVFAESCGIFRRIETYVRECNECLGMIASPRFRRYKDALRIASFGMFALLTSSCDLLEKRAELRYKMTVTVERGGREYTSFGVQEIKAVATKQLFAEHIAGAARVNGEGIVLDLPTGPVLISLRSRIGRRELHNAVLSAFNQGAIPSTAPEYVAALRRISRQGGQAILSPKDWPLCIELPIEGAPTGARFMTCANAGVSSIHVEVTDEAITTRMKNRFPWLTMFEQVRVPDSDPDLVHTEYDPASSAGIAFFTRQDVIFNPTDKIEDELWERRKKE